MPREIKFRAWDKTTGLMCDLNNPHWSLMAHPGGMSVYNLQNGSGGAEYDLMQYTGLKDKNGKEIYEGDIVKLSRGCPHEIIWKEEIGGMLLGGMPGWYLSGLNGGYAWTEAEEVIGNIYENPDLLTNEQL